MYYLDTKSAFIIFEEKINSPIYVDKSLLIEKMNDSHRTDGKYICITRPRRFAPQARRAGRQSMRIGAAHPWRVRSLLYKRV